MAFQHCLLLAYALAHLWCIQLTVGKILPIERKTFSEVQQMLANDPSRSYLQSPFIMTESPMRDWTLLDNLQDIFDDDAFNFEGLSQTTNCSCFESAELCQHYASTLLYLAADPEREYTSSYEYWKKFETDYSTRHQYDACITQKAQTYGIKPLIEQVVNISQSEQHECVLPPPTVTHDDGGGDGNISIGYTYFRLAELDGDNSVVDALQLNTLDHIRLSDYFKLLAVDHGYGDITDVHMWFGLTQYRATRHYDRSHNLFFMLRGGRKFRLSAPAINVWPLYPFGHLSDRHQYRSYAMLQSADMSEGVSMQWMNDIGYDIYEDVVAENEMLFLPSYWWHEVVNDNFSFALSLWYDDVENTRLRNEVVNYHLPINPEKFGLTVGDLDEFAYFMQRLIETFCARNNPHNDAWMQCTAYKRNGGIHFLLRHFTLIYPVLNTFDWNTFEWMTLGLQFDDILKCSLSERGVDEYVTSQRPCEQFKHDFSICYSFEESYEAEWNEAIANLMEMIMSIGGDKKREAILVEYLMKLLLTLHNDTTVLPIMVRLMYL